MGASSAYDIQGPGTYNIFSSTAGSTASVGAWKRVHHDVTRVGITISLQTASAGATAGTSGVIEFSHDGVTPLNTKGQSFTLTGTTDLVADGGALVSSMNGAWPYIRFNMQSLSSSTAGSAGFPAVNVNVTPGFRR